MKDSIKTIANFIIGSGVMTVVGNAVAMTTPGGLGLISKALVAVGSIAVSAFAGDKVSEWAEKKLDEVDEALKKDEEPEVVEVVQEA